MLKHFTFSILFVFFINSGYLFAADGGSLNKIPDAPTPSNSMPEEQLRPKIISRYNDLTKPVGAFNQAKGRVLYINGTVRDVFQVPVSGAVIEIWQANAKGYYQNLLDKDSPNFDKNFSMSGSAITDNLGRYSFVTLIPGTLDPKRAPHIYVRINEEQSGFVNTEIYFEGNKMNLLDKHYLSYPEKLRSMVTARMRSWKDPIDGEINLCIFDIVLDKSNKFRSF